MGSLPPHPPMAGQGTAQRRNGARCPCSGLTSHLAAPRYAFPSARILRINTSCFLLLKNKVFLNWKYTSMYMQKCYCCCCQKMHVLCVTEGASKQASFSLSGLPPREGKEPGLRPQALLRVRGHPSPQWNRCVPSWAEKPSGRGRRLCVLSSPVARSQRAEPSRPGQVSLS